MHLIRDPRDVVVSGYFSHLKTHPKNESINKLRDRLKKVDMNEGLFLEMDYEKNNFNSMIEWDYNQNNIYEAKLEEIKDSTSSILEIFKFLDLISNNKTRFIKSLINKIGNKITNTTFFPNSALSPLEIGKIVENNSFRKLSSGRNPGQVDETSHYRKGVSGDWRNYFTNEHKKYFKDQYGDLLIILGYEKKITGK